MLISEYRSRQRHKRDTEMTYPDQAAGSQVVSITGLFGLPTPDPEEVRVEVIKSSEIWQCPPPRVLLGGSDESPEIKSLARSHDCESVPVYVAEIRDALVSPKGLVFTSQGKLVMETIFPWELKNFRNQFSPDLENSQDTIAALRSGADAAEDWSEMVLCREGGEVGYFHFVNSILPRVGLLKKANIEETIPVSISGYKAFAKSAIEKLQIKNPVCAHNWRKVSRLLYLCPFTLQGSHYSRPPFAAELIRELNISQSADVGTTKIYVSRSDANVRRLTNEDAILNSPRFSGFNVVKAADMSWSDQLALFGECRVLMGAHGAGLANMAFMPAGGTIVEILSPARLWPTFKAMAARHGHSYYCVVGDGYDTSQTAQRRGGNEDFSCSRELVDAVLVETK